MLDFITASLTPALVGYALGSIPFGYILTRLSGLGDIRTIGSGNIGATNVLRTGHKGLAALTLLLDGLKGALAVVLGSLIGGTHSAEAGLVAGLAAFIGHIFPIWLRFRGGKGVATYLGVIAAVFWQGLLVFTGVWLAVAFTLRYSSLAALAASVATPLALAALGRKHEAALALVMTLFLFWKHSANIGRLWNGEEPKIGARS